MSEKLSSNH